MDFKFVEEPIKTLNEENTPDVLLLDEADFKEYLLFTLLKGHTKYQKELDKYYVHFVDPKNNPEFAGTTAAVDAGDRIIYISIYEVEKLRDKTVSAALLRFAEDTMSYLIRHELLHSILDHQLRAIIFIADFKGWDPALLDPDQYEEVLKIRAKPDILFRNYNGRIGKLTMDPITKEPALGLTIVNGPGDYEVSKFYLDRDIELTDLFGGLLLDDHPLWKDYAFEELMAALIAERRHLYRRLYKRVYGTMDLAKMQMGSKDAFSIRNRKNSIYSEMRAIDPRDVTGVRLLNVYEYDRLPLSLQKRLSGAWLTSDLVESDKGYIACDLYEYTADGRVDAITVEFPQKKVTNIAPVSFNSPQLLFPVLVVPNLDLYDNIGSEGKHVSCLGLDLLVLPDLNGLLFEQEISRTPFYAAGTKKISKNTLRGSAAQSVLDDWLEDIRDKYNSKSEKN